MPKPFSLIAACAKNRVIGRQGRLPWRIPEDFRHFLTLTAGRIVILGRISFESWTRADQDGRRPVVITRDQSLARAGVHVAASLTEAFAIADDLPGEVCVCGGQRTFEEAIVRPEATRLCLTLVHAEVEGDRYFPEWSATFNRVVSRREGADADWRYSFLTLER